MCLSNNLTYVSEFIMQCPNFLLMFTVTAIPWEYYQLLMTFHISVCWIKLIVWYLQLEALRERRPPWPRQIITPILSTAKMLSLGCERLPTPLKKKKKKKKKKKGSGSLASPRSRYATTITVFFCSFTHLTMPRSPPKFNQFLLVLLRTRP